MSSEELQKEAWNSDLCDRLSWRGLLSEKLGITNLNFSSGGSSNQRQFRLATVFFGSELYQTIRKKFDKIIVLWGLTSTSRNELWCLDTNNFHNFMYTDSSDVFANFMVKNCYDHDAEVYTLRSLMMFWNRFFEGHQIENFWFDTFNTHDYDYDFPSNSSQKTFFEKPRGLVTRRHYDTVSGPDWPSYSAFQENDFRGLRPDVIEEISSIFGGENVLPATVVWKRDKRSLSPLKNLIDYDKFPRDLMTRLAESAQMPLETNSQEYHHSSWQIDREYMQDLVNLGLLNPYSHHPTQEGHRILCGFFLEKLHKVFTSNG